MGDTAMADTAPSNMHVPAVDGGSEEAEDSKKTGVAASAQDSQRGNSTNDTAGDASPGPTKVETTPTQQPVGSNAPVFSQPAADAAISLAASAQKSSEAAAQQDGGAAGVGVVEVTALRVQDGNRQSQPKMLDKLYTCKWKNGTLQTARVVERRLDKSGNWEYYMHYEDFDRRLDEWVGADRLGDEVIKHRSSGEVASAESNQKMTRTQKRRFDEIHTTLPVDNDPTTAALEHEREQATKVKNIQTVEIGKYEMETWYYSPYPEEFSKCAKLFLCEFCLKYFRKAKTLERHKGKCEWRHPPGDEVYRHDNVSMFEVDGKKAKIYCQVQHHLSAVRTR
jgi:hypothetical protein